MGGFISTNVVDIDVYLYIVLILNKEKGKFPVIMRTIFLLVGQSVGLADAYFRVGKKVERILSSAEQDIFIQACAQDVP